MVISRIIGGLGNQMFQYAVARHLALLNNTELKLDITGYGTYEPHPYGLNNFNITEKYATKKEIEYFYKYKRSERKIIRKFYNFFFADKNKYVQEKQFNFDPEILTKISPIYLDGYWVCEKYFKDIDPIIRKDFTFKNKLSGKNKEVADQIKNCNSVAVHIRRGEMAFNPFYFNYHGVCSNEYYKEAESILNEKIGDIHLFIFSDSPEWVKNNMTFQNKATYMDHNKGDKNNFEDLRLMSLCKHNVIANSSFSWWGAWLNDNPDKIIIGPQKWFTNQKPNTKDVMPDSWIKI